MSLPAYTLNRLESLVSDPLHKKLAVAVGETLMRHNLEATFTSTVVEEPVYPLSLQRLGIRHQLVPCWKVSVGSAALPHQYRTIESAFLALAEWLVEHFSAANARTTRQAKCVGAHAPVNRPADAGTYDTTG